MKSLLAMVVLVFLTMLLRAQQDESSAPVRVARLSSFSGAVRVERADNTGDPSGQPVLNQPIGDGTRVLVDDYAEAELEFEDGSVARLTSRSALLVDSLALEGGVAQSSLTVLHGLVYLELRKSPGFAYAVSAGGVVLSPVENSIVRVSLEEGPAIFSVLSGAVRVEHGFSAEVRAGESLHADATDESRYFLAAQIPVESWDSWNAERDRAATDQAEMATAARDGFAGNQGYGWSDLDSNGTWYDVPGEGQVWQPAAADEQFDPYGFGSWVWQGVGYAWASGYSWGWVPYRCGHWSYFSGFGWGWQADGRCGRWGSTGGGVLLGKLRPPHYQPILVPVRPVSLAHPTVPVRSVDGPRPALLPGGVRRVHGQEWRPLPKLGLVTARTGSSLQRDYPVNGKTGLPVLGVLPKGEPVVHAQAPNSGWRVMEGTRRGGGGLGREGLSGSAVGIGIAPSGQAHPGSGGETGNGRVQPVRTGPVQPVAGAGSAAQPVVVIPARPIAIPPVRIPAAGTVPASVPAAPARAPAPSPVPAPAAVPHPSSAPAAATPRAGQNRPQ